MDPKLTESFPAGAPHLMACQLRLDMVGRFVISQKVATRGHYFSMVVQSSGDALLLGDSMPLAVATAMIHVFRV